MATKLIVVCVIYTLLVVMETINAVKIRSSSELFGKYMFWFWLIGYLLLIDMIYQVKKSDQEVISMIIRLGLDVGIMICMLVYLIYRGLPMFGDMFLAEYQEIDSISIRSLTQYPLVVFFLISILIFFLFSGRISAIFICWDMFH